MPRFSISRLCPQICASLVLAASLAGSCVTAFAGEVGVAWDAKTEPEIVGYKIYYQGVTHSELRTIDVGSVTTYTVTGLDPDTYYFCVTAYDPSGNETGCSNVVSATLSLPMYGFRDESCHDQHERFRAFRMNFTESSIQEKIRRLESAIGSYLALG